MGSIKKESNDSRDGFLSLPYSTDMPYSTDTPCIRSIHPLSHG